MSTIANITQQETARYSDNLLPSFANFNQVFAWNKVSGGSNATIINSSARKYAGSYSCNIAFTGTSQVKFNAGSSDLEVVIPKNGNYILSYRFFKDDLSADITFLVEVLINGVAYPQYTFEQNLFSSSGYIDGVWNCYFQSLPLNYRDTIDFNFYAQSDTTACNLWFDGFKLELDDRNLGFPSTYTETPLEIIEEENILTIGTIPSNGTYTANLSLFGAKANKDYVSLIYPSELITLGLIVGQPLVTVDNEVKVLIHNHSGGSVTPSADLGFYPRVIR